jgi:hypothetical protein
MTNKKEFIKVNIEDLVYAKEFFDNTSDYSLWLYAVTEYYQGNEVVIKKKIVKKYFDNYKKTMNIVIEAKEFGKKGALKRYENQQVKEDTLIDPLPNPLDDTLPVNNKVLNINNKEHIDFQALLEVINFSFSRKFEMINEVTQKKFNKLLKDGYKKQNILFAIKNCVNDTFHKENNYKYCTPDYFARPKTIDMYGNDLPIGIVEEKNANNTFAWDR